MSKVKLPIVTKIEGNKITKVCVEDVYKILNRVQESLQKSYDESVKIINSINKDYVTEDGNNVNGELIIGTGISQPSIGDAYDEEIGMKIAFMKAKLNANIKKHNFLCRIYNQLFDTQNLIENELKQIDDFISMDLRNLRQHNPSYLSGIEYKLGI